MTATPSLLKGTAFLTGAGSGIGRATALSFARYGIQNLALTDISPATLLSVSAEIASSYPHVKVETWELDVRDEHAVQSSIAKSINSFGRLDIAVNVAGVLGPMQVTHECSEESWRSCLDVNLDGVWRCQKAEIKAMLQQEDLGKRFGRGVIVNVASIYGLTGPPGFFSCTPYTASKHAVMGLTKCDATLYAAQKIRINAVCPGYIATPLLKPVGTGALTDEIVKIPAGRLGDPEEIADSIVYMASPLASYMIGTGMVVDGGYTAN